MTFKIVKKLRGKNHLCWHVCTIFMLVCHRKIRAFHSWSTVLRQTQDLWSEVGLGHLIFTLFQALFSIRHTNRLVELQSFVFPFIFFSLLLPLYSIPSEETPHLPMTQPVDIIYLILFKIILFFRIFFSNTLLFSHHIRSSYIPHSHCGPNSNASLPTPSKPTFNSWRTKSPVV